jgi:hypothetical protein
MNLLSFLLFFFLNAHSFKLLSKQVSLSPRPPIPHSFFFPFFFFFQVLFFYQQMIFKITQYFHFSVFRYTFRYVPLRKHSLLHVMTYMTEMRVDNVDVNYLKRSGRQFSDGEMSSVTNDVLASANDTIAQ